MSGKSSLAAVLQGLILGLVLGSLPHPAQAQEAGGAGDYGGDSFRSGATVIVDRAGIDDLFAVGSTVNVRSEIGGSAFLAGRSVDVAGAVAGDVFAAGMDVIVAGAVAGDVTAAGNNVTVGEVGGDLRISGGTLTVNGPVAGYAMIAGDELRLQTVISGTLYLAAREVDFAEGARVEGRLVLFEEDDEAVSVPESVVDPARIERREIAEWEATVPEMATRTWLSLVASFVSGVLVIAVLASLIAAIMPDRLARLRRGLLAQPFRNLWFGFLAESVAVGSAIIFATTLIGLLLVPASVFVALAAGFAGYVVAAYAVGVALLMLVGRPEPDSIGMRFLAAGTGALVVSVLALIPFFGWLFALALVLAGVGAITLMLFRPGFFVDRGRISAG